VIKVIDTSSLKKSQLPEGNVRSVLTPSDDATKVRVSIIEVEPGKTYRILPSEQTQVAYLMEGKEGEVTFTSANKTTSHPVERRCGLYLEPKEEGAVKATGNKLVLLHVTVPKHTGKPIAHMGDELPAGYFFNESKLQALVDEKRIRTRTFWVNKETGLSNSWDLQIGRMLYAPNAYSPRHVHNPTKTNPAKPEHFYFIETGTGEVKFDGGSLPVGPGSLVLIPSGEWHQLRASQSGFDYIEFQAPFDFTTTMDHDPQGKNWYIQGTDDGNENPKLWVQS
jgi:mannose-6-phosphate isomerase-like protein (cupin superfamily)